MTSSPASELLADLRSRGVLLTVADGRIRYEAPQGVLSADVLARLREHKAALIELLQREELRPRDRSVPARASFAQERFWLLEQLDGGKGTYNTPLSVRLVGRVEPEVLERALREIERRHEVLRTTFQDSERGLLQIVHDEVTVRLERVQAEGGSRDEREAFTRRVVERAQTAPFDLARGPMFRATLIAVEPDVHVLIVATHHIAVDGWSSGLLAQELSRLYPALAAGQPSPLTELAIQYGDYAEWQRARLDGAALAEELAYWKKTLTGAPTALELPTDRTRPAVKRYVGANLKLRVPASTAERLRELGRREGATLFMMTLAAYGVLLSRWSGQKDIVVGTPTAGRTHSALEPLIGVFVNTLALRISLDGAPTFRQLLARVKDAALGAFAHQDVPFGRIVEELNPARETSRTPIFQTLFALQNLPPSEAGEQGKSKLGDADVVNEGERLDVAQFDVSLYLHEDGSELRGNIEYETDLFDRATVERMAEHFVHLLDDATKRPDEPVTNLELMSESERRHVVRELNATAHAFGDSRYVHQFIEDQARRTPDAVALVFEGQQLTYAELDADANRMAAALAARGVGRGAIVAVCMDRSLELLIALVGTLKSGAAYAPLNPADPPSRLHAMVEDLDAAVVLVGAHTAGPFAGSARAHVVDRSALRSLPSARRDVALADGDLAYIIFTSGSTGKPKGVMSTHGGMRNRLLWAQKDSPLGPGEVVLQKTAYTFDVSVWELFWPLMFGARTVIARPDGHRDPRYVAATIREHGVTLTHFVPSMLAAFLESYVPGSTPALRRVVCSGEALPRALQDRFLERVGCELQNLYGPTEASIDVSHWLCRKDAPPGEVPIGYPVANTQLYVVDEQGEACPIGVPGELLLGGLQLARGYWRRVELTAERFVPDRFSGEPGARLYRTGDLARWRPDGAIEYLGRIDHQVKVRGFRIELGEIESALSACDGVARALVLAREDVPGDKRLVGYVVPEAGATISIAALRETLAKTLPEYMVPSAFVSLDAFPLNSSGKIDRKALPAPDTSALATAEYVAPRTPVEVMLAEIWQDLLGIERVGVYDEYFALGGHSLNAMKLIARIRERLGLSEELSLRQVFLTPTLADLAAHLDALLARRAGTAGKAEASSIPLTRAPAGQPLVLSFAQERLWFLSRLEPTSNAYTMPWGVRFVGELSVPALEKSVEELVRRHDVLRMTIADDGGRPNVRVTPSAPITLPVEALGDAALEQRIDAEMAIPFDLAKEVVRFKLLRLSDREHVLLGAIHHIVTDGWSIGVLNRELVALYEAFSAGRPSPLPAPSLSYFDYAAWQRSVLGSDQSKSPLDYWLEQLRGVPAALELPTDRPFSVVASRRAEAEHVVLSRNLTRAVRQFARSVGASTFMTLHAAFALVLARLCAQEDIVLGMPVTHRPSTELEGLIGLFVNTLAVKLSVTSDATFRSLVAQAREASLNGIANQDVPFEMIVEHLNPERSLLRTPVFQVMMVGLVHSVPKGATPKVSVEPIQLPMGSSKFDMTLYVDDTVDEALLNLVYAADFFDRARMKELLAEVTVLVEAAIEQPDVPLKALSLVTPESRPVLPDPKGPLGAEPQVPVYETVFAHADRNGASPAIAWGEVRWTYADLRARARTIAGQLAARGVGHGARVVVAGTRSPGLVATILAVWSVGGVIVPVSDELPKERRSFMASECKASLAVVVGPETVAWDIPAVHVDPGTAHVAEESAPGSAAVRGPTEADAAYVFFTSGTTGKPKGVLGQQRGLAHFLGWQRGQFAIGPSDRAAQLTALGFDVVMRDMFTPLTAGAVLCIPREPLTAMTGDASMKWLRESAITMMHSVPSVMAALLPQWEAFEPLASMRLVFMAGEPLTDALVTRLRVRFPNARIINLYGPTETTLAKCFYEVPAEPRPGIQPVGRPLPGAQALVVNEGGVLCGVGEPGEIVLRTPYRSLGYLNEEHNLSGRFQPNPFTKRADDVVYRTGDRGRYRPDGLLEILGRVDDQVKIHGVRVEPAEVAATLLDHPTVGECFVTAFKDGGDHYALAAYLVAAPQQRVEEAELRTYLATRLPAAMIPAVFVVLEKMPLLPNGKIDRKALPVPEIGASRTEVVAPRTPLEETIAGIWREVLKIDGFGVHDDYFALGGHSLNAMQMITRVRAATNADLPFGAAFSSPTIAALAAVIEATTADVESGEV